MSSCLLLQDEAASHPSMHRLLIHSIDTSLKLTNNTPLAIGPQNCQTLKILLCYIYSAMIRYFVQLACQHLLAERHSVHNSSLNSVQGLQSQKACLHTFPYLQCPLCTSGCGGRAVGQKSYKPQESLESPRMGQICSDKFLNMCTKYMSAEHMMLVVVPISKVNHK